MAWLESHQTLQRHPKALRLSKIMGWSIYETIGRLHAFWWWCLDYHPLGSILGLSKDDLQEPLGLQSDDCKRFIDAMIDVNFIDLDQKIHDWHLYAGRYLKESKFKRHPDKVKEFNKLYETKRPRTVRGLSKVATLVPNQPNLTQPNPTKPDLRETPLPPFAKGAVIEVEKSLSKNLDFGFETFWQAYPKKIGKGLAQKSFLKIKPDEKLLETMIAAISSAQESEQWKKDGGQFIPMPSTWLNQERWGDEHAPKRTGSDFSRRVDESIKRANEIYKGAKNVE